MEKDRLQVDARVSIGESRGGKRERRRNARSGEIIAAHEFHVL